MAGRGKTKVIHSLDSPYSPAQWPALSLEDQETTLVLLCTLLAPIGEHRALHVTLSKGKRSRRHAKKQSRSATSQSHDQTEQQDSDQSSTDSPHPPQPEILSHITIGFNSTIRHLEALSRQSAPSSIPSKPTDLGESSERKDLSVEGSKNQEPSDPRLAAVFVCRATQSPILHDRLPLLTATASLAHPSKPAIRLVSISRNAQERLSNALKQPRVGIVGLLEDAPLSNPLVDFVREHVPPVEVPWLSEASRAQYLPVSIKSTELIEKVGKDDVGLRGPHKRRRKEKP